MASRWRQAFHLEPPHGWLNDPNGLCWFGQKYHVYFQFCPTSADGSAGKEWGHFESPDFVHWRFTGAVLHPDTPWDQSGVYSGCGVPCNTTLHLFYTGNVKHPGDYDYITAGREANVIHVATKDGCTMGEKQLVLQNADYPGCTCHVRDPKVFLLETEPGWGMLLGARTLDDQGGALLFTSDDLSHWSYRGTATCETPFGYMWECPDAFAVGEGSEKIRLLSVSPQGLPHGEWRNQNVYQSGWFVLPKSIRQKVDANGMLRLSPDTFREWDMGFDFYAPQSFAAPDGRRILIGWMGLPDIAYENPTAALGWQHCLTVPCEVTLDSEHRVCRTPVRELFELRGPGRLLQPGRAQQQPEPFEIFAELRDSDFTLTLAGGLQLSYRVAAGEAELRFTDAALGGGRTVRRAKLPHCRRLQVLVDASSVEFFLDGGACVFSTRFYPASGPITAEWQSAAAAVLYPLNSLEVQYDDNAKK